MIQKIPKPKTAYEVMFEELCNEAYKLAALSADMPLQVAEKVLENNLKIVSTARYVKIPDSIQVYIRQGRLWFTINDEPNEYELKCSMATNSDQKNTFVFEGFLPESIFAGE